MIKIATETLERIAARIADPAPVAIFRSAFDAQRSGGDGPALVAAWTAVHGAFGRAADGKWSPRDPALAAQMQARRAPAVSACPACNVQQPQHACDACGATGPAIRCLVCRTTVRSACEECASPWNPVPVEDAAEMPAFATAAQLLAAPMAVTETRGAPDKGEIYTWANSNLKDQHRSYIMPDEIFKLISPELTRCDVEHNMREVPGVRIDDVWRGKRAAWDPNLKRMVQAEGVGTRIVTGREPEARAYWTAFDRGMKDPTAHGCLRGHSIGFYAPQESIDAWQRGATEVITPIRSVPWLSGVRTPSNSACSVMEMRGAAALSRDVEPADEYLRVFIMSSRAQAEGLQVRTEEAPEKDAKKCECKEGETCEKCKSDLKMVFAKKGEKCECKEGESCEKCKTKPTPEQVTVKVEEANDVLDRMRSGLDAPAAVPEAATVPNPAGGAAPASIGATDATETPKPAPVTTPATDIIGVPAAAATPASAVTASGNTAPESAVESGATPAPAASPAAPASTGETTATVAPTVATASAAPAAPTDSAGAAAAESVPSARALADVEIEQLRSIPSLVAALSQGLEELRTRPQSKDWEVAVRNLEDLTGALGASLQGFEKRAADLKAETEKSITALETRTEKIIAAMPLLFREREAKIMQWVVRKIEEITVADPRIGDPGELEELQVAAEIRAEVERAIPNDGNWEARANAMLTPPA